MLTDVVHSPVSCRRLIVAVACLAATTAIVSNTGVVQASPSTKRAPVEWIATTVKANEKVNVKDLASIAAQGRRTWSARGACTLANNIVTVRRTGICTVTVQIAATATAAARTTSRRLPVRRGIELNLLAAASLSAPFEDIARDFSRRHRHVTPRLTFAGSSTLATQVLNGAPVDVVAMADTTNMAKLTAAGLATNVRTFARNQLAILTAKNNPRQIRQLGDLTRSSLTVVLCDVAQPCGRYAEEALTRAGVRVDVASRESSVAGVIRRVQTGEADAGIGYVSDAASNTNLTMVSIPDADNVIATYPIAVAVTPASGDSTAARAFASFVMTPIAQQHLISAGFRSP